MKKFLLLFTVLALSISVCAQDNAGTKTIQNQTEYNVYVAAINTADPGQKCAALDSYFKTYPNSIMKPEGYTLQLSACQQAGQAAKALEVAGNLISVDPNNLNALTVIVFSKMSAAKTEQDVKDAGDLAIRGLSALDNIKKVDGETDVQFQQRKTILTSIFNSAAGRGCLVSKDWACARKYLRIAVEANPDDANNIYFLARAYMGQPRKERSDDASINGLFFWARVVVLTAANKPFSDGEDKQGLSFYKSFHGYANSGHVIAPGNICQYEIGPNVGTEKEKFVLLKNMEVSAACNDSSDGWDDVKATAAANKLPPAGFTIKKIPPPTNADLIKAMIAKTPIEKMDFGSWIFILTTAQQDPSLKEIADKVWDTINAKRWTFQGTVVEVIPQKDANGNPVDPAKLAKPKPSAAKPGAKAPKAEPALELSAQKLLLGVTLTDDGTVIKTAEVEVSMLEPLKAPPAPGTEFQLQATMKSKTDKPFMLIMDEGTPFGKSIPTADKKPVAKKPAAAHAKKKK